MFSCRNKKNIIPFWLTHCRLKRLPHTKYWMTNFHFRYVGLCYLDIPREKWLKYLQTGDPDQMPHSVVSDLDLHCLPLTLLEISRLQWVKNSVLSVAMVKVLSLCGSYILWCLTTIIAKVSKHVKCSDAMANSVDHDQTAPKEQFDEGLHFLLRHPYNLYGYSQTSVKQAPKGKSKSDCLTQELV